MSRNGNRSFSRKPHAVVTPRKLVKAGELWAGTPARYTRALKPEEIEYMRWVPGHYR
jgi:carbonic anhydrase/acetyltransferase-like protein (isoleucine patch superfamily)